MGQVEDSRGLAFFVVVFSFSHRVNIGDGIVIHLLLTATFRMSIIGLYVCFQFEGAKAELLPFVSSFNSYNM